MKNNGKQDDAPATQTEEAEQMPEKKRRQAGTLLHNEISSYLVRAWYEYHGSPYGDTEEGLMRWTQEQLDRLHAE